MKTSNKKKNFFRKLAIVFLVIVLISFAFSFEPTQQALSSWLKWPIEKTKVVVRSVLMVSLGVFLISTGIATLAIPILGGALIVIGVALLVIGLWPIFKNTTPANEVEEE